MKNEHLDNIVRDFADCMDYRLQRISRRRRTHPSVTDIRRNLFDLAFCDGTKRCLNGTPKQGRHFRGLFTTTVPNIPSILVRFSRTESHET
jgi:hypothetical protein